MLKPIIGKAHKNISLIDLENIIHMKLLRAFVFLFFTGIATGNAQTLPFFSMHEMNPLLVNPAKSGDFLGTVRLGGLYREQWGISNITAPYAFFDSPIMNGFRKKKDDWIGMGAVFYKDVAGAGNLPTIGYFLSASYHLDIGDKKNRRILTMGARWGQETLGFGFTNNGSLYFASDFDQASNSFNQNGTTEAYDTGVRGAGNGNGQTGKNAITVGFLYKANKKNSKESFEAGIAFANINSISFSDSLSGDGFTLARNIRRSIDGVGAGSEIPAELSAHMNLKRELIKNELYLEPTVYVNVSNVKHQYNVHGWLAMNLKDKETEQVKDQVLKVGLGYRHTNVRGMKAPKALLGYETSKLKVAFAFDYYLGKIVENNYGFELAANYIISSPPKIELPSKIFCPQL